MKEITSKKFYQCEFYNKISLSAGAMKKHERACKKNPENIRACIGCEYCDAKTVKINPNYGYGEKRIERDLPYCSKLDMFIYPPKCERNDNYFLPEDIDDGETECIPMPKVCEYFKETETI